MLAESLFLLNSIVVFVSYEAWIGCLEQKQPLKGLYLGFCPQTNFWLQEIQLYLFSALKAKTNLGLCYTIETMLPSVFQVLTLVAAVSTLTLPLFASATFVKLVMRVFKAVQMLKRKLEVRRNERAQTQVVKQPEQNKYSVLLQKIQAQEQEKQASKIQDKEIVNRSPLVEVDEVALEEEKQNGSFMGRLSISKLFSKSKVQVQQDLDPRVDQQNMEVTRAEGSLSKVLRHPRVQQLIEEKAIEKIKEKLLRKRSFNPRDGNNFTSPRILTMTQNQIAMLERRRQMKEELEPCLFSVENSFRD